MQRIHSGCSSTSGAILFSTVQPFFNQTRSPLPAIAPTRSRAAVDEMAGYDGANGAAVAFRQKHPVSFDDPASDHFSVWRIIQDGPPSVPSSV